MNKELKQIAIIPAVFLGYREDGNVLIRCLDDERTVDRALDPIMIHGIENPKLLLLGVITGGNTMGLNLCDGTEFEDLFLEKWHTLFN